VERAVSEGPGLKTGMSGRCLKNVGWEESTSGPIAAKLNNEFEAKMDLTRSGVVAFGK
jgi:hypothetical protein